jgi:hypothetical protein
MGRVHSPYSPPTHQLYEVLFAYSLTTYQLSCLSSAPPTVPAPSTSLNKLRRRPSAPARSSRAAPIKRLSRPPPNKATQTRRARTAFSPSVIATHPTRSATAHILSRTTRPFLPHARRSGTLRMRNTWPTRRSRLRGPRSARLATTSTSSSARPLKSQPILLIWHL